MKIYRVYLYLYLKSPLEEIILTLKIHKFDKIIFFIFIFIYKKINDLISIANN
jgi:hypothetical protein